MNNKDSLLFDLCLQDQLFCTMYNALNMMHNKYNSPSPTTVWMESLMTVHDILESPRPDMKAKMLLENADMTVVAVVLYILFVDNMDNAYVHKEVKDIICSKLSQCEHWKEFYEEVRCSEEKEEQNGRYVTTTDYESRIIPKEEENQSGIDVVKEVVAKAIATNDYRFSRSLAHLLRRIDDQHSSAYHKEILRLELFVDEAAKRDSLNIAGDYVVNKQVSNEVNGVAAGATGISINQNGQQL